MFSSDFLYAEHINTNVNMSIKKLFKYYKQNKITVVNKFRCSAIKRNKNA